MTSDRELQLQRFGGGLREFGGSLQTLTQDQIRTMPMLYRASLAFAVKNCPLLTEFVDRVKSLWMPEHKYESLDVKVCMLKKGWWPCIPGWHLDDFYRPTGEQPDIRNLHKHSSTHYMTLFGDASLTQFIEGECELEFPPDGETVYGFYNKLIELWPKLPRITSKPNKLYKFTSMDFHRGMPATKDGWRAFVRLTLGNERPPKDEIRTQVQVYVPHDEMFKGW